jgi:hypothetical protein
MKITILPVALLLVLSICSCAKTWMEDKTADTSAVDNSDAVTSISVTPQSAEPGVYTGLSDFLTEEQIQLYILSAKVDALPESAEKARFKYALIGGSPVVYVFDDDMRFYLAYLNIDMHFASVYECTLMLPAGYTDGQIIAVKGSGCSGEYFISVAAKAGEKNVILDYFFFSNGDLPQPKSVEVFSCVE